MLLWNIPIINKTKNDYFTIDTFIVFPYDSTFVHMNVSPRLQLLSTEQMEEVHRYSIRILENTSMEVESSRALKIFEKSDGAKVHNRVVYLKDELINHAIKQAPSNIEVFNQRGDATFQLGKKQGKETHFGIGVTNTWFQGIEGQQVELFTRKHMQHSTRLGDLLDNYAMVSTLGIPSDVPARDLEILSIFKSDISSFKVSSPSSMFFML